jgi:hypothetical protein
MKSSSGTRMATVLMAALACTAFATPASLAQEATKLGSFTNWTAWKSTDANGVICYISSDPQTMLPANVDHGDIHFLVIHRKGSGVRNEVQSLMGYQLRGDPPPTATVDGKGYNMVVEGKAAWLASAGDEPGFVDSMKRGSELVVKATSQRGTNTTYNYSLSGVTAAMNEIDKACS